MGMCVSSRLRQQLEEFSSPTPPHITRSDVAFAKLHHYLWGGKQQVAEKAALF